MKKVLQKSLRRLHALLLLAGMFVVGGSAAWAQDVSFSISADFGYTTKIQDGVSIYAYCNGYSWEGTDYGINPCGGWEEITITAPAGKKFSKVILGDLHKFSGDHKNMHARPTECSYDSSNDCYVWEGSSNEVVFYVGNSIDVSIKSCSVWYEDNGGGDSGDQGNAGITFNLKNFAGNNTVKDPSNKVSVFCAASGNLNGINIWGSRSIQVNSLTPEPIERIVFKEMSPCDGAVSIGSLSGGHFENGNQTVAPVTWIADNGTMTASFGPYNGGDFYLTSIEVFLAAPRNYIDFNYTSTNAGSKGYYTLSSDVLTFGSPVTVTGVPTIDGVNATATANGNVVNISFDELNTPGEHTLVFPRGSLQIGDDYNNEIRVTYTLAQDPNKAFGTFNFNGAGIPYTNNGVDKTLNSGNGLNTGDVFTSNDVLLTFTNANKDIAWSNMAQRLRLGQNTAFTIAAPDGFEVKKVVFKTDANYVQLSADKGNTSGSGYATETWTGSAASIAFRASYDTYIQTIEVSCERATEIQYEVAVLKGTEEAEDDWTITINGVDGTFHNGSEFSTTKKLQNTDIVAPNHDGYHDGQVEITGDDDSKLITVTYDVFEAITYKVDFSDNAPVGASVTIDGHEFSADDDNWPVAKDLNYYSVTEVNAPAGWYADYDYDPFEHKFTFDFKEYNYYSVVVKGISDPAAGVTYHGNNYGAGQQIEAREELTEGSVTASNVTGYEGHVSLVGNTFTVTYSAPTYIEFVTSGISNTSVGEYRATSNGVTIVGYADSNYLEIWNRYYLTVTSATLPIDKVEFVAASSDFSLTTNSADNGSFVGYTWYADAASALQSVTFKSTSMSYNNYISSVRVYLRVPQLTTYNLAFTGEVPDGAKVTIEEQQYGAGTFDTYNENFTTADIDATWPGYDADVTYNEETSTFTVTYYATTTYDVVVSPEGLEGAAVIYNETEYPVGTGVITCRGTIDPETLSAKSVYGYVGEVTVADNTITVTYTESEYFDVAESQVSLTEGDMVGTTKFKVVPPAGKSFSEILVPNTYGEILTINGETNKWTQLAIGYEGSFITFTNPNGPNDYGTFVVEFPADCFKTADGKKNNAFTYTYTVEDPAAFTEPYYVNMYGYQFGTEAPAGASVNLVGFDETVSESGQQHTAHPNVANFGDATTDLEGYDVTTSVNTDYKNVSVYFHKLAAVSSYTPATVENSLDDEVYEYGYNELVLTFAAPFKEAVSIAATAELPAGMSVALPAGVTRGQIYANSGSSELHIGLNGGKVAGDYSVEIAKNLFSFSYAQAVDGTITNDAFSQTWTLNAATTFRVDSYAIATEDVEGNEFTATQHNLNKFQAFAVSAPAEQVFSAVTNPVTVDVTVGDADPVQVAATAALEEEGAKAVFTLPAAYTEEGDVSVSVPAGVLTLGGLTSKAFEFDVTIQPYDYFSISAEPAPETTYTGDRNTIVITLPVGKTADTVGSTISLNGNPETVTAYAIDGNTVTLTLENGFQYGSNYYNIPAGFLTDTNGDKNSSFGSWSVNVVKHMMYASAYVNSETTTTNSVTVEKFSNVEIYFDEPFDEYVGGIPAGMTLNKGAENVAITAGWTQKQTWEDAYNDYKYHSFYFYFNEISAPGTYTVHIPAGVFTSAAGHQNEEVNLDIVIPTPEYFAAMTVNPATGTSMESLSTITLTAPDGVTFDDVKGLQGRVTVNEDPYNYPSNIEFADDKKSVTFNISEKTTDGEYTVTFPEGFVRSTDGKWSLELSATYTVSYPWFTLRSNNVTPATGEVAAIENITIAAPAGIEFATPAANVTIVVNGENTLVGASLVEGKMVLDYTATAANRYEISIPAETFTSTTGKKNKELTGITYTIQPSLAINEHSMDDKGDTWTTFCLNKDFTLEDGYTPYIVRNNGEGGIKLVELMGTPIVDTYNCYFNSAYGDATEHTDHSGTINSSNIAGKYQVTYESNQTYNDGGYYDITYGYKNLVFTIKVLDGAQAPSNAGALYYNPTLGTEVSTTFNQISDDTFTVTVESGHWASHVGGLYIEVATGTYNTPIVPANTGILVKGAAKSGIQYTKAGGTKADVSGNLLWGCTQSQTKVVGNDQYIYKLAWASSDYDDFGFYWGSSNGHSIQANAGKAYLILDADQSAGSNRMLIFGGDEGTLTAIDAVESVVADAPIFNLQGKRMPNTEHLPAGVYVQNGRKFIVK